MAAAIEAVLIGRTYQPEVGLVNECRRLERLPRLFVCQFCRRQLPQLVIHQRQELLGCRRIAGFNLREDHRHIGHGSIL
jgi:hypothetical protein